MSLRPEKPDLPQHTQSAAQCLSWLILYKKQQQLLHSTTLQPIIFFPMMFLNMSFWLMH